MRLRGIAVALLWAFVIGPADLWHSGQDDDLACRIYAVSHDPSAHRVEAPTRQSGPDHEHCYTCHWLRSLHTTLSPGPRIDPAALYQQQLPDAVLLAAATLASGRIPGRSPPA
jgi:hypothetical protein